MVEKIKATDGAVFRQLRHNHQLTLAQVADDHNSIAFISKFEQGKSNISFSRLTHLLYRINISVEEFVFIRDLQSGVVPTSNDPNFVYNTLTHRAFVEVLDYQDAFQLRNRHQQTMLISSKRSRNGKLVMPKTTTAKPASS